MINDEWWLRSLEELRDGSPLQDSLIVEMENSLHTYSFQGNTEISRRAAKLRDLLFEGCLPLEELYGFCKGEELSLRKLTQLLQKQSAKICNSLLRAFVAQPFWPVPDDYYEKIIRPACVWEGINPIRVNKREVESNLIAKAHEALSEANLFVADVTGNNQNVFYEAGYLEGRGIHGLFLSLNPDERLFYTAWKDIIEIKLGPDGVAESRRRLREGLRKIKTAVVTRQPNDESRQA